jgi:hypothetical protein
MDFLTSIWGIMTIIHVVGWVVFQPYLVRAVSRNTVINCPEGNSAEFCKENHPLDCRFKHGIQKNVDSGSFWGGTLLAFFWEFTALFYFMMKRASKADPVQKEYQRQKDQVSLEELQKYQTAIEEMKKAKELETKAQGRVKPSDGTVYMPEPVSLRQVKQMVNQERRKEQQARESYGGSYHEPEWMRKPR